MERYSHRVTLYIICTLLGLDMVEAEAAAEAAVEAAAEVNLRPTMRVRYLY